MSGSKGIPIRQKALASASAKEPTRRPGRPPKLFPNASELKAERMRPSARSAALLQKKANPMPFTRDVPNPPGTMAAAPLPPKSAAPKASPPPKSAAPKTPSRPVSRPTPPAPATKPKAPRFSAAEQQAIERAGATARTSQTLNAQANARFDALKKRASQPAVSQDEARKRILGI